MDGNGRWAKARHLPRISGHRAGIEALRNLVRAAGDLQLEVLTLYAFSRENWKRPDEETGGLMELMKRFIVSDINELADAGIRLHMIGEWRSMAPDVVALIDKALERTANNRGTRLVVALNYGGQDELVRAARAAAKNGEINADTIACHLDTAGLLPLDLLIRTSGEVRLSNFLLWQAAYAELYFTEILWPDFGRADLVAALAEFARRERRYGAV